MTKTYFLCCLIAIRLVLSQIGDFQFKSFFSATKKLREASLFKSRRLAPGPVPFHLRLDHSIITNHSDGCQHMPVYLVQEHLGEEEKKVNA